MIERMLSEIAEKLTAKKYPLTLVYSDELKPTELPTDIVAVFMRNRQAGDGAIRPRKGAGTPSNTGDRIAKPRFERDLNVIGRIYVQSSLGGANLWNHEELCDMFVDAFLTELQLWSAEARANNWSPVTATRYLRQDEIQLAEGRFPGVVYEVQFSVPRGVLSLDYTLEGRPKGDIASVTKTTRLYLAKAAPSPDPPETGCGS